MKRAYKKENETVRSGGEMDVIGRALREGRRVLSEYESKQILRAYGIPVTRETEARDIKGFRDALAEIGFPLVVKVSSPDVSHKTERGLVHVDIRNRKEAMIAFKKIMNETKAENASILIQEMVIGDRELMIGLKRDPQFGPCVAFGLGGIFTEILQDICVRIAPIEKAEVVRMMKDFKAHRILDAFRGMPCADLDQIARMIITVGRIGIEEPRIKEIDINPVMLAAGKPVAVDALVALY